MRREPANSVDGPTLLIGDGLRTRCNLEAEAELSGGLYLNISDDETCRSILLDPGEARELLNFLVEHFGPVIPPRRLERCGVRRRELGKRFPA